jgi:LuxR family quorum-sensing system transcriptional regulator CciR
VSRIEAVNQFIASVRKSQSREDLFQHLESISLEIGFRYFALVQHVDLNQSNEKIIHFDNYPASWTSYFIEHRFFAEDPVHQASLLSNVGFSWEDVPKKIRLTKRQRRILAMAARHGLRNGYTVPANIPGESTGSCSFATTKGQALPEDGPLLAELIGSFAFDAARRLLKPDLEPSGGRPHLTARQRDCLLLVIHGKTDKEIGIDLGISGQTVTEYLDILRRRYGVKNRLVLAVRAIYDGQISFIEALAQKPPIWRG